jgi:hypothetical protein
MNNELFDGAMAIEPRTQTVAVGNPKTFTIFWMLTANPIFGFRRR